MKKKFNEIIFDERVLKALRELRYDQPLEVQQQVIPIVLENRDVIVKSQTGSGKTGAFGISICEKIDENLEEPQALIIAPTRELAIQVSEEISEIGKIKGIRAIPLYGKQAMEVQRRKLKEGFHVVVGTPGRLVDHLKRKSVKILNIKYLILDEADQLLSMGFLEQMELIINKLPQKRVTLLFSATIPSELEIVCKKYMINPINVDVKAEIPTTATIKQAYFETEEIKKFDLFKKIMRTEDPKSCIIFCNTRDKVSELARLMGRENFSFCEIHGGLDQKIRLSNIRKFKKGQYRYLIATDVAARGIHVNKLSHVINYNLPFENENYVHRIGRTGRIGKNGVAITFVTIREYERFLDLQEYLGYKIKNLGGTSKFSNKKTRKLNSDNENLKGGKNKKTRKLKYEPAAKGFSRISINCGGNKDITSEDIVRTITNIKNVLPTDINLIKMYNKSVFVDIKSNKVDKVLIGLRTKKIKGRKYNARRA